MEADQMFPSFRLREARTPPMSRIGGQSGEREVASVSELASIRKAVEAQEVVLPRFLVSFVKYTLDLAQTILYQGYLHTYAVGTQNIPRHLPFIVAANHVSHLDMGAIKIALGEGGKDLSALAAADYFFKSRWRRAYFTNFTNLVPMARAGSVRRSLDMAKSVLQQGRKLLIFPEGTRSKTGRMEEFLPSVGYLALATNVGILPTYIDGAFALMPKGRLLPHRGNLVVRFGPFLTAEFLAELTEGLPKQGASRLVAFVTEQVVTKLRDGGPLNLSIDKLRSTWYEQRFQDNDPKVGLRAGNLRF